MHTILRHTFFFRLPILLSVFLLLSPATGSAQCSTRDDEGNTVSLAAAAQRIITLTPHAAELVATAGAGKALIAVGEHSDAPPEIRERPVIGSAQSLDLERIVMLKPDLIVAPLYLSQRHRAFFRQRGIALYVADAPSPEGIADNIEAIGCLAGTQDIARDAAHRYHQKLAAATTPALKPRNITPTVFYELWEPPLYTVAGNSLIEQAIHICGGRNIFSGLKASSPVVSLEAVLTERPQIIVVGAQEQDFIRWKKNWQRWPQIPAVRNQAIIRIDPDLLHRPGPRFAEGVTQLCEALQANAMPHTVSK